MSNLSQFWGGEDSVVVGQTVMLSAGGPPVYQVNNRVFLRSGFVLTSEEESYPEAYAAFAIQSILRWTNHLSNFGTNISCITRANGMYVAGGGAPGRLATSPNGITWTLRSSSFDSQTGGAVYGVTYGNGLFVAVGNSGKIATSADAVTWNDRASGTINTLNAVTYGNGLFVAVGSSGTLLTSPDAVTWTARTSGFGRSNINDVTYGNGLFVAVGSGRVARSSDGISWSPVIASTLNAVTYGNGLFVAVGSSGTLLTSPDAVTWTARTSGFGTSSINDVTYGNGLFVAAGGWRVAKSNDGVNWILTEVPATMNAIAYADGMYVAVGQSGNVVTSPIEGEFIGLQEEYFEGSSIAYMRIK